MTIRKEHSKSIILTTDKEFKQRAVNFLNNIGFPAEKHYMQSVEEMLTKLGADQTVRNILVDADNCLPDKKENVKVLLELGKKPKYKILVYGEEATMEAISPTEEQLKESRNIAFAVLPFDKRRFNDCFHGSLGGSKFPTVTLSKRNAPRGKLDEGKPKSLSAFEASAHVKDTISLINEVKKAKNDYDKIGQIGQRFNGLVGSFAFYGKKPGWYQLTQLAQQIDEICFTYQDGDIEAMTDPHYNLMVDAAKFSFMLLQHFRNGQLPPEDSIKQAQECADKCAADKDVKRKEKIDQNEVDSLLEAL